MTSFAKKLTYYRKLASLNQTELAEKVGITSGQVSKYERGLAEPRPEILSKIASILNVSNEELLTEYKVYNSNIGGLIEVPILEDLAPLRGGLYGVDYTNKITINVGDNTLREFSINPKNVVCATVKDNRMLPLFSRGTIVAIDTNSTEIVGGDFYAYTIYQDNNEMLEITALERLSNDKICARPINRNYKERVFDIKDVKVIGAIFWYSSVLTPSQSLMLKYLD